MRFGLLGPLAVWTDEGAEVRLRGAKVRALLAHLLVAEGKPVSVGLLLEELWGAAPPGGGAAAVQTAVSRLRRALDEAEPGARALVVSAPAGYRLSAAPGAVDAARFSALLAEARGYSAPERKVRALADALELWRGPALADHAESPYCAPAAARWEEQRAAALEQWAAARLDRGGDPALLGDLDELVRRYPLREGLRAVQMRALYRGGRQAEALAAYRDLQSLLAEEAGVDPGRDLVRLHQALLEQAPELDPAEVAVRHGPRAPGRAGNLPAPLAEVVGRDSAAQEVRSLMAEGRLVTLTGPGGVGKTTLALLAAGNEAERHPDGVWFAELAGCEARLVDTEEVAEYITTALGLRDDAGHVPDCSRPAASDRLAQMLRDRALLLVVDDCERVAAPVAEVLANLLRAAPHLRVLATSREPLGVPGERLYPVPPLDAPTGVQPDDVRRSPAARLFLQRAAASAPGFQLTRANAPAVAEVCCRLDGLPLALELAAARMRVLDVAELAARLDDRFRLLNSGGGGLPARQRTLRAVIDWSWEPLNAQEKAVLRRLSVHAGSFPLASAEAVGAGGALDRADVLGLVGRLVDCSLLVAEVGANGTRYRMLESIAAYARERLAESGESEQVYERFAHFWGERAEDSDERLRGPEQPSILERLDEDGQNLRKAIEWSLDNGRASLAVGIAGALGWYTYLRGRGTQGERLLSQALEVPGPCPDPVRARALAWHGILGLLGAPTDRTRSAALGEALELYRRSGDETGLARTQILIALLVKSSRADTARVSRGGEPLASALGACRRLGDPWGVAAALLARGWECLHRGDLPQARAAAEEANARFAALGDVWGKIRGANLLGIVAEIVGDYGLALRLHLTGLECSEQLGLEEAAAEELVRMGRLAILGGDFASADRYHEDVLKRTANGAFPAVVSYARAGLAMSARRQGNLDRAEHLLRQNLALHTVEGFEVGRASVLAELGFVAEMRGRAVEARALHLDGLHASQASGDPRAVAQALEGLAGADALEGNALRAARLLGAAAAARQAVGAPQPSAERFDVDRITTAVRAVLGDEEFDAAHRLGESSSLDRAVEDVAADPDPAGPQEAVSSSGGPQTVAAE